MKLATYLKRVGGLTFQLLLKGCTIEAESTRATAPIDMFQLLLKGCTIEAYAEYRYKPSMITFQLLLKGCTIEAKSDIYI